jgi:hypothetical protein
MSAMKKTTPSQAPPERSRVGQLLAVPKKRKAQRIREDSGSGSDSGASASTASVRPPISKKPKRLRMGEPIPSTGELHVVNVPSSSENSRSSDGLLDDDVEYLDSVVMRMTPDEVDATIRHYESKYVFETTPQGCRIMKAKRKRPKKTKRWEPLRRKKDGYLQVTVPTAAVPASPHPRFIQLFGAKRRKVLWHQLCWRKANAHAVQRTGMDICHSCPHKDCGVGSHLSENSRLYNETQKKCCYVYIEDDDGTKHVYLLCRHDPQCRPALQAQPLRSVTGRSILDEMEFL